ncbi:arginase family protein [Nonomuraea sp. NPDC049141]|uniref:arginase family protein n=1 Tax=Nonomuraea sp. NPDC049141 TaxID=3155500 RepID=UPI0033E032DB
MSTAEQITASRRWLIIGAPMEGSGTRRGEIDAPGSFRRAGLVNELDAVDFGDLPVVVTDSRRDPSAGIIGYHQIVTGTGLIADAVSSALLAGWRPFLLGGCCSILPGALTGLRRHTGPAKLIFIDGHLDLFTPRDTRTGEVAGMALAIVTGYAAETASALAGPAPLVEPGDVLAIGDADGARRQASNAAEAATAIPDARVLDATSIHSMGAEAMAERTAALIDREGMPFWLHLDVDVLDEKVMPAVSFPVSTGIGYSEAEVLLRALGRDARLIGVSVAGFNARRDPQEESARRMTKLLGSAFA